MEDGHPVPRLADVRTIRLTARCLALLGIPICGIALVDIYLGAGHPVLPPVVTGAPSGVDANRTELAILTSGAGFALSFVGAILAFRWERTAAKVLIAAATVHALVWVARFSDPGLPLTDMGHWMGLFIAVLPPSATAFLLLIASRDDAARGLLIPN